MLLFFSNISFLISNTTMFKHILPSTQFLDVKHVCFLYRKTEATRIDWKILHQEARKLYVYTFLIYDRLNPAWDTVLPLHRLLFDSSFFHKMLTALIPRDSREYFIHMHTYGQLSWDKLETFNLNSLTSNLYPTFFSFFSFSFGEESSV